MSEPLLDDPVLSRVVRQHCDTATRTGVSHCKVESSGQNGEFFIDRNTKSLECPLGRMTSSTASWCRNRRCDDVGQLQGRSDRTSSDDRARDSQRKALIRKVSKHPGQFLFCCTIDQICSGSALTPIHPHVERCIESVGKASLGNIELM